MQRAIHIGWITDSLKSILGLVEAGMEPIVINTQPNFYFSKVPAVPIDIPVGTNLYQDIKIPLARYARMFFLFPMISRTVGFPLHRHLTKVVKENGPIDFVLANWGTGVLPEVMLLKQHRETKRLPVILNMETFPTSWRSKAREALELRMFTKASRYLAGVIVPTPEMAELIQRIAPRLSAEHFFISPFYYPKYFFPENDSGAMNGKAGLSFIGQVDLSRSLNDVRQQLMELASAGFSVHCVATAGIHHENITFFPPMSGEKLFSGEIDSLLTRSRACLMTYNLEDERKPLLRYRTSLPSRFLLPLGAGVPLLLPKNRFAAMERIVSQEQVGYAYSDVREAYEMVTSSEWETIWLNARAKSQSFRFNGKEFQSFVRTVLTKIA